MWTSRVAESSFDYGLLLAGTTQPREHPHAEDLGELRHATQWFGLNSEWQRVGTDTVAMTFFGGRASIRLWPVHLDMRIAFQRWDEIYFLPVLLESVAASFVGGNLPERIACATLSHAAVLAVSDADAHEIARCHLREDSGGAVSYPLGQCTPLLAAEDGIVTLTACPEEPHLFKLRVTSIFRSDTRPRHVLERAERQVKSSCEWLGFRAPGW
jgi:hypothetical protein